MLTALLFTSGALATDYVLCDGNKNSSTTSGSWVFTDGGKTWTMTCGTESYAKGTGTTADYLKMNKNKTWTVAIPNGLRVTKFKVQGWQNQTSGTYSTKISNVNGTNVDYALPINNGSTDEASYTYNFPTAATESFTFTISGDKQVLVKFTITAETTGPSISSFSPVSGTTVKSGTTITITGSTGSTVFYKWDASAQSASDIYNSGSGSHGTADAGSATTEVVSGKTLYAVAVKDATLGSVASASYTVDGTAPTLSSSSPANGATGVETSGTIVLTFSEAIASVDGSKFTLTGATKGAVAIDGSDSKKVNVAYSGADYESTVTLSTAAEAVADAVGNKSAALSDIAFTTKAQTYSITFAAGGGSGSMAAIEDITSGSEQALTANTFTRDFYNFSHWTANVDVTVNSATITAGNPIADGATIQNITSDITLTAQWEDAYANGTYVFDNTATVGTAPSKTVTTEEIVYDAFRVDNLFFSGMKIQLETGSDGDGDNFKGWKIKSNGTIKFKLDANKRITIGLGSMGGSSTAKITYTNLAGEEQSNISLTAATNNSYMAKSGTVVTISFTPASTKSIALKKIFIQSPHSITYALGTGASGTTPTETDKAEGEKFTLHNGTTGITAPSGKVFNGWNDGTSTYAGGATYTMPDNDVTLTAQWATAYTVTYALGTGASGTTPTETAKIEGVTFTLHNGTTGITAPTGKVFAGWNDGTSTYAGGAEYTMPNKNVTLTAQWASVSNYPEVIILNDVYDAEATTTGYSKHAAIAWAGKPSSTDKTAGDPENDGAATSSEVACYSVKGNGGAKNITISITGCEKIVVYHESHASRYLEIRSGSKTGTLIEKGSVSTYYTEATLTPSTNYTLFLHGTTGSDDQDLYVYAVKLYVRYVTGTISSAGWSTFSSNVPLDLSTISGGTAYYASAASGNTVTLTQTTAKVAAEEGLMIKGTAGATFTINTTAEDATLSSEDNYLVGVPTSTSVAASTSGANHYVFGYESSSVYGFYNLAEETNVPARKAYLETATPLVTGGPNAPAVIRILDEEKNATSIERIDGKNDAIKFFENGQLYILREGVVYDALGRKIR